jgi:hypothetical protein
MTTTVASTLRMRWLRTSSASGAELRSGWYAEPVVLPPAPSAVRTARAAAPAAAAPTRDAERAIEALR